MRILRVCAKDCGDIAARGRVGVGKAISVFPEVARAFKAGVAREKDLACDLAGGAETGRVSVWVAAW